MNCTNKGCEWKGELKDLPAHLNKGKREGQCQYEEVTFPLNGCGIKKQCEKHERYEIMNVVSVLINVSIVSTEVDIILLLLNTIHSVPSILYLVLTNVDIKQSLVVIFRHMLLKSVP